MIISSQPRAQRRFRFTAHMQQRQHFLHAHIDKALRSKLGINRRAVQIAKGDTVKVVSGSKRGSAGKVTAVDLRSGRIAIDSLTKKTARGKEFSVTISANNVYITDLNLSDKRRAARLHLAQAKAQPAPAPSQQPSRKQTQANESAKSGE